MNDFAALIYHSLFIIHHSKSVFKDKSNSSQPGESGFSKSEGLWRIGEIQTEPNGGFFRRDGIPDCGNGISQGNFHTRFPRRREEKYLVIGC